MKTLTSGVCLLLLVCAPGCKDKPPAPQKVAAPDGAAAAAKAEEASPAPAPAPQPEPAEVAQPKPAGDAAAGPAPHALPASLANLYPPKAKGPVYLMKMHEMSMPLHGIVTDLMAKDLEGAKGNLAAFKKAYTEVAALVPEWKDQFPADAVDGLDKAVQTGNPEAVMGAFQTSLKACTDCHAKAMIPAAFTYHWPKFGEVTVDDPLMKKKVPYTAFMHTLAGTFNAIAVDLKQGQKDAAMQSYQGFKAAWEARGTSCESCHDSDRHYFVDASLDKAVVALGEAVAKPDPEAVMSLSMKIGVESCHKCHLVHLPAAMFQRKAAGGAH